MNSLDFDKKPEDTRVVVAMSGGVDSSVAAGLLKRKGYDVIGVTLQLYNDRKAFKKKGSCCAGQDINDARQVCHVIGIPHYVLDYEQRFHDEVITPFAESYLSGDTPIPCVSCNQTVKFVDLISVARQLGADALATGHYINSYSSIGAEGKRRRILCRSVDLERDQSYFLFATTQEQVDYLRFPLGEMRKEDIRCLAREMNLEVAEKLDSQDICFVQTGRYSDIVAKLRPDAITEGDIVHLDGRVLGRHQGIMNYTIGQRRGLGVATGEPLFVVYLDARVAQVIVGPKEALKIKRVYLREVNWLGDGDFMNITSNGYRCFVKLRSTQEELISASITSNDAEVYVDFNDSQEGISPGQACVFYSSPNQGAQILGGGFIVRSQFLEETAKALQMLLKRSCAA
ncbi:tRNA (5-methylaminomethyl-2-thiouridylate)-methyltransferase [Liberibacter crescens BT-1]|uniref:tRNA-specific 2-thiouridylase MnmA n=1 Tax=Liberibacter crescens (strain BT-1) TaxID=1215343 RepID=L0EVF8_LIBCB|nr:tRNA 2-thiouridine(34) synthase MnmA [Liberibacter crescens]AGA64845.1 tRNA (5-methylaminomethyl-2-thiouridylate)-methyltransferase [Liberibacter crescens BT-1]AMC12895.1 tRNA 2-thiouridylase [Liberibacter crescens]